MTTKDKIRNCLNIILDGGYVHHLDRDVLQDCRVVAEDVE